MKLFSRLSFLLVLSVLFSGCWFVKLGLQNTADSIFGSPEIKVENKITDPVKDDVRLSALWVGHSTVLLQMEDKVILIDPVFEDAIAGIMMRKVEAGLDINSIPKLDLVLVSHAHMDHMSLSSLKDLDDRFSKASLVFPKGSEEYLPSYDMDMVRLKTGNSYKRNFVGETRVIEGVKITAVFAQHFGGRYGLDSYLWNVPGCTGYIIEYKGMTVFFAGDTSYDEEAFKSIGGKYNIDLALIPIGPCRDCDTDGNFNHVASLGALKMLDDLQAEYMIPVHYGAITYFNDPDIPLIVLKELIDNHDLHTATATGVASMKSYTEMVKILNVGEQYIFEYKE